VTVLAWQQNSKTPFLPRMTVSIHRVTVLLEYPKHAIVSVAAPEATEATKTAFNAFACLSPCSTLILQEIPTATQANSSTLKPL